MFVKAVEDEVGDGEVIFAPLELEILDAAVMKSDCMVGVDAINPGLGQIDHGLAGVDAVDLDGGVLGQKLREESSVSLSEDQTSFRGQSGFEASCATFLKLVAKGHVFQPSVPRSQWITVHWAWSQMMKITGVRRARSAEIRSCSRLIDGEMR